jgi:hypothetical protein
MRPELELTAVTPSVVVATIGAAPVPPTVIFVSAPALAPVKTTLLAEAAADTKFAVVVPE